VISYEFPLNERIRTLLRLDDLFRRLAHFIGKDDPDDHHAALLLLFETSEVAGRADLKVDLVQELERQRQTLASFRNNPEISETALAEALFEIEQASTGLLSLTGKVGQSVRDNEWLASIRSRAAIPGGVCQFDLPAYHYWLNLAPEQRRADLASWLQPLAPIRKGQQIVLRLLRGSGRPDPDCHARNGVFQLKMTGRVAQMVRLRVPRSEAVVPELSANKYALNVRFMLPDTVGRPRPAERDVSFELTCCCL
jgi:cell division protein ZapD